MAIRTASGKKWGADRIHGIFGRLPQRVDVVFDMRDTR